MRFSFTAALAVLYAAAFGFCLAAWRYGTGGGACPAAGCSLPGDAAWLLGATWCLAACALLLSGHGRTLAAVPFIVVAAGHALAVAKGWAAGLACRPCLALLCLNAAGALACGLSLLRSEASPAGRALRAAAVAAGLFALAVAAAAFLLPVPAPGEKEAPKGLVTAGLAPPPVQDPFLPVVNGEGVRVLQLAEAGAQETRHVAAAELQVADPGKTGKEATVGRAAAAPCPLAAFSPDGTPAALDLRERPVLVFAAWCSPCGKALEAVARLEPGKRPRLAAYAPGYVLPNSLDAEKEKLAGHGLGGEPLWVLKELPAGAQALPALVRCGSSGPEAVTGAGAVVGALEGAGRG